MQVSVCPGGAASGYTYFIPQEEHLESSVVTRGYMEGRLVVGMAGRSVLPQPAAGALPCPASAALLLVIGMPARLQPV